MKLRSIPLLMTAIAVAACNIADGAGKPSCRVITLEDDGSSIGMYSGDIFEVSLQASAGSGFEWHLESRETDIVKVIDRHTVTPSKTKTDIVGGRYRDIWVFKALKQGRTHLRFDHYPPWESPRQATRTFAVTVVIEAISK